MVYNNEYSDNSVNTSNVFQSSITIFSCTKLNGTTFYLFDLLHATILLDTQHSELASIQRQIVKYLIDPFLSVQITSNPPIQLSVDEQEEDDCIKRSLYITKYLSNSNGDETSLTKEHHDRCTDAEKMLQHTDLIMQFIFNGIFNNTKNGPSQYSLEPLRQLFGCLLLPHVLGALVTKAMVPVISLSFNSLSDLPIALNDLDALAKMAIYFEKQWITDYAHLDLEDGIDLPLGKYVNRFDQHVALQRRSLFLNDARKIMLRKVYDAEEYNDAGKITQTPKILLTMIQQMIQEIQLLSSGLDKYPETVATLKKTIQEVIMLFITIMPSFHRHLFLQHDNHAMIFHNDCYWLADSMATLKFQDNNEAILTALKRLGDTWKRVVIAQFLTKIDVILNKTEEWHHSALPTDLHLQQQQNKEVLSFESAIELIIHHTNTFITNINDVVIKGQCKAILISITNDILKKIIDGILSMDGIAADTSRTMAQGLNGLAQLATLFSKVIENEESVSEVTLRQWVPKWQPFWVLKDMLDMTMADILDALYRGDLTGFTHDQLIHLICSLFADTPRRDETVQIIKSSDLSGAPQKSVFSPMSNSQGLQSKRSISLTNPHNEQPTKRSFLERLLIPEDESQKQCDPINSQSPLGSSTNLKLRDQYKVIDTSSHEKIDKSSSLNSINRTPVLLQHDLPTNRFSFKKSVNNDEWNQNINWSDDDDNDDSNNGSSKIGIIYGDKDSKSTSKNTSNNLILQQDYDGQNSISDKFNYNESLVDTDNKWDESDALELFSKDQGFKREIEQTSGSHDNKGVSKSIQQSITNNKFCFNEVLNNENDGWDQYEPLDVVADQIGNDESTDLMPMKTKVFSHNQIPIVSNKFGYNETLDENAWGELESLNADIDVTNNEYNIRLAKHEGIDSVGTQIEIDTHVTNSENDDHMINESNQLPSNSQAQINLRKNISSDSEMQVNSFGTDIHDASDSLNLVIDEKNKNTPISIDPEELTKKLIDDQQQQQFDDRDNSVFNSSLHVEDFWGETEPLYTNIENISINLCSRQQDQPKDDNNDDDIIVKGNGVNIGELQLDLLGVVMNKDEEENDISSLHEPTKIERQVPKYDNMDLNENNQHDRDMDLLEQGLYDPSQMGHQNLPLFDDTSNLDGKVNEIEQLESSDKNITTNDKIQDIKSDPFGRSAENIFSRSTNESINIINPISSITITENNKNSELYKVESKVKSDNDYIVDNGFTLSKLEQVTNCAVEDNLKCLAKEITNHNEDGEENDTLNRLESLANKPTAIGDDNGNNETIILNQLDTLTENIVVYDDIENTEPEQLEQADKGISVVNGDENIILDKLESTVEKNVTDNLEVSASNLLESTAGIVITDGCDNNIILSQLESIDKSINNGIKNSEDITRLDGGPLDDNELDTELMEKILPKPDQSQEQIQKNSVNSYDESELAVNFNENAHIQRNDDPVTLHFSIKSEGTSNDTPIGSLSLDANVKNDHTSIEEVFNPEFDLTRNTDERCSNPNSIIPADDRKSKKRIDALEGTKETFTSISVHSDIDLLDASTSSTTTMDQVEIDTSPIDEQKITKNIIESDSVLNSVKYDQPKLLETGVNNSTGHTKDNVLEYAIMDNRYSTQRRMDGQLIKSELQQQTHLNSKFVFDDTLLDDGWDQDDDYDLNIKSDKMDGALLKTKNPSVSDIQSKNDVKIMKENHVANDLENTQSISEKIIPSFTNNSIKQQENSSIKSRFSFNNNLAGDEAEWNENNISCFVSNDVAEIPTMNVKQTKSILSYKQHRQQPGLKNKFKFNDTVIDDDGWDQEEPFDAILNSTPISTKSNEQLYIKSNCLKTQQDNIHTDGWAHDEFLNMTDNIEYIEGKKIKAHQIESGNNDDNELNHSKLLHHKIKNEISEGMSTKLEQTKPDDSQQQQPEHPVSFVGDRFTFDGLSDDSGWDQDSGWLDDDDNFILTTVNKSEGSPPVQNKQPNQISTEMYSQQIEKSESDDGTRQKDTIKTTTLNNPSLISSTMFAFNDEEPIGWSDADEDIF
ncbi:unnamed protein product [Cunninghamella blakesleeana]